MSRTHHPLPAIPAAILTALACAAAHASDIRTSTSFTPLEAAPVAMIAADGGTLVLLHELPLSLAARRPDAAGELVEHAALTLPGNRFTRLAAADITGDGHPDIAILSATERLIHILVNQGDGTFLPAAKSPYPTPSINNTAFAFGDLDGTGAPDLLLGAQGGIVRYPNLGGGELGFPAVIAPNIYGSQLLVADFKAAGQNQIAVVNGTNIRLLERNGDSYQATLDRSTSGAIFRMTAGNPLPDGRRPILAAQTGSRVQTMTYNPNNNTFTTVTSDSASGGTDPTDASFADINADGVPDLIMGYAEGILLGATLSDADSSMGYTPTPAIGRFYGLRHVAVLDVNGDGLQDTVHASTTPPGLITFLQHPEHGFREHGTVGSKPGDLYRFLRTNAPNEPPAFFLPRFVTGSQTPPNQQAAILPGQPGPIIQTADFQGPPAAPTNTRWTVADLDHDGRPDLIEIRRVPSAQLTSPVPHALFYHRSAVDGTYADPVAIPFTAVYNMSTPVVADFNNDGIDDVAVMDAYGLVFLFLGAADGEIAPPIQFQFIPHPGFLDGAYGALMAADLDSDGHIDLVGANRMTHDSAVYIAYGLGGGQFEQAVSMPAPPNAGGQISPAQATGDLNNDGVLDIAITGTYQAVVYLSEGPRAYAAQPIASDPAPRAMYITDFNADGLNELVLAFRGNTEVVRFEDGQPLPDRARFLSPDGVQAIHFEDLTGDGLPDMLVSSSGGLSIIYSRTPTPPPCPADINADGLLNFFDVAAYIALYNADDPRADLAAPFGTLNFFDLAAYINLYNAGCP